MSKAQPTRLGNSIVLLSLVIIGSAWPEEYTVRLTAKKKRRLILLCRGLFVCVGVGGLALLTIPGMRAHARAKSSHQNVALETKDSATAVQVGQGEPSWGEGFSV